MDAMGGEHELNLSITPKMTHAEENASHSRPALPALGLSAGSALWYVMHPDAEDLGLTPPFFKTKTEADAACERWNAEIPGHWVLGIEEAPPEFTSSPNTEISR